VCSHQECVLTVVRRRKIRAHQFEIWFAAGSKARTKQFLQPRESPDVVLPRCVGNLSVLRARVRGWMVGLFDSCFTVLASFSLSTC